MAVNAAQTRQLLCHGEQVQEGSKGDGNQTKGAPQIELAHILVYKLHPRLHIPGLVRQLLATHSQHGGGQVQACHLYASAGCWQQHTAGAAAHFQDRGYGVMCHVHEEGNVLALAVWHHMVVKLRHKRVLIICTGLIHWLLLSTSSVLSYTGSRPWCRIMPHIGASAQYWRTIALIEGGGHFYIPGKATADQCLPGATLS
jgi:hypothetical protein